MAASVPAVNPKFFPVEIKNLLEESLPIDDLRTAYELAQAKEVLLRAAQGTAEITLMQAGVATDHMKDALRIRDILWNKDADNIKRAYEIHRDLTGKRATKVAFFDEIARIAKLVIGKRDMQQRQKADDARREQERLNREAAEREQKAKADALLAEAADLERAGHRDLAESIMQEAEDAAQAPLIPIATPDVAPAKIPGVSVSYKLVGTVADSVRVLEWLLDIKLTESGYLTAMKRIDLINELVVWSQSGLDAALKRGLRPPGVDIERKPQPRNISRR